jgi:amino acid adenylation domain-containing protein
VPPAERETELARRLAEEALRPFDLATGPLLRVMVLQLDDQEHVLALTIHHIVADGWSLGVLWRDLAALYAAAAAGHPADLAPLPIQYADYAAWQHAWLDGPRLDRQLAYWRDHLADAPTRLELPTDHPRPAVQGSEGGAVSLRLGPELTSALRRLAAEHDATLYMVLLAAFQTLLHRYTGQDDLLVGAPIAGRPRPELEGLVGLFINTLVLRADLHGDPSFRELLARTRDAALDADAHQDLPFERLVTELDLERDLSHHPLVQVLFTLQNVPFAPPELPGLTTEELEPDIAFAKVDLSLHMQELGDGMRGRIEYDSALFDRPRIVRMAEHLRVLLGGIAAEPDHRLSHLPLLSQADRQLVVEEWNQTATPYPAERSIPELFAEQAQRTPDAIAVELGDARLTYRALDARANQLAHRLRALGVGSGRVVGIQAKRSVELVAGLLGILKAGGAYLPLDPAYPAERLAFMLADARVDALLVDATAPALASSEGVQRLMLDPSWTSFRGEPETAPTSIPGGMDPAYVMYTSGSTGTPKGVVVPHRAIARLVVNTDYVTLRPDDVVAQASNVSFDAATFEVWGALLSGARLTIVERDDLLSTAALASAIEQRGITTLFLTTALFNELARSSPPALRGLRQLLFGGEAVDPRWVRRMLAEAPPARLLHVYGPTETTTFATWQLVEAVPADATTVPIGRPIANTTTYILDPQGRPVPIGVPGELFIGGPGVALGYLERPDLTAEKFVADPSTDDADARLYRTGDLVRYRVDGTIEFLGRLDQQVKIRGFRIEPGEIEAVLTEHPGVRDAVVMARDDGGDRRLVAYVVPEREDPSVAELRGFVGQRLPDYMVPAAFVLLASLPLTANGKLDRDALPPPEAARPDLADGYVAPRTPTEAKLADIWARVLGIEDVGVHDNFFDLGGDSILGMQVVARARQAGLEISASHLFQHDTIAELAPLVDVAHVSETVLATADAPLVTLDERQLDRILTRVSEDKEPRS